MTQVIASEIVKSKVSDKTIENMECLYNREVQNPMPNDWVSSFYWFRGVVNDSLFHLYSWQIYPRPFDPYGLLSPEDERCILASYKNNSLVSALKESKRAFKHWKASSWERNFMIRIFINGVLDVHQPCRCANFYSPDFKEGNLAGLYHIVIYEGRTYSLVELWDSLFGEALADCERDLTCENREKTKEIAMRLMERYPEESFDEIMSGEFQDWADESYQIAIDHIYQEIQDHGVITSEYVERCRPIAERQLVLASYRLAYLLEGMTSGY